MKVKEILQDCSIWMPGTDYDTEKPMVSVLLPTFRQAKSGLFETAVRSVLDQDFKSLELIIIDDASIDGTADLINYFMQSDPRVSCIRHRFNIGLPAISEYEGYLRARGEYIAFIFDDNQWELNYIGKTISCMLRNRVKASYGKIRFYYSKDQYTVLGDSKNNVKTGMHTLYFNNHIPNGAVILAREVVETVGLYDPHVALTRLCDWDLWKRVFDVYEFFSTGILAGKEKGVSLPNSLGNSYKIDYWISAEREQSRNKSMLLPSNFPEIEIDEISENNSQIYTDGIANMYQTFSGKKWFRYKKITHENKIAPAVLRVMVIATGYDASLTFSFGRVSRKSDKDIVVRFGEAKTPLNEIIQADAVILMRDFIGLENIARICQILKIPCYLYMDDNFIELSKDYNEKYFKDMRRYLESEKAKKLNGIIVSTGELKKYFENANINKNVIFMDHSMCAERIIPYSTLDPQEPVTVAYMGGAFRDHVFETVVMPALMRIAYKRKIRVLFPSRIDLKAYEHLPDIELIPFQYDLSLEATLFRIEKYCPQYILHCGPHIRNNTYKTENVLINAVQLGAVLVSSDEMPYSHGILEHEYCACACNNVEDWCVKLQNLIEDQEKSEKIWQRAHTYCLTRYSPDRAINTLKQTFKEIKPTSYYVLLERLSKTVEKLLQTGNRNLLYRILKKMGYLLMKEDILFADSK